MPSVLPTQVRHLSRCRYRRPTASLLQIVEAPTSRWIMATKPPPSRCFIKPRKIILGRQCDPSSIDKTPRWTTLRRGHLIKKPLPRASIGKNGRDADSIHQSRCPALLKPEATISRRAGAGGSCAVGDPVLSRPEDLHIE